MYTCPLCKAPLVRQAQRWACENRHSFDIAKESYVNLLPVQNKRSLTPGDNAEMMQARRAFLNQGFYQPLADYLACQLQRLLSAEAKLLDLGCGEGYYTQSVASKLNDHAGVKRDVWGIDISKTAIRYASKREPSIEFSVASAYQLPFPDHCFDALIRVYAPSEPNELKRVIKPGGYLLTVQPGAEHLIELKHAIYQTPRCHDETYSPCDGFTLMHQKNLRYTIKLNTANDILNLINMTPFGWKLTTEKKQQISQTIDLVQADFLIQLHQKLPQ